MFWFIQKFLITCCAAATSRDCKGEAKKEKERREIKKKKKRKERKKGQIEEGYFPSCLSATTPSPPYFSTNGRKSIITSFETYV